MARKRGDKSEAIREYLNADPKAGPTKVVGELKKKGMTVTVPLVSNVKSRMLAKNGKPTRRGRKPGPKRRGRPPGPQARRGRKPANEMVAVSRLLEARNFADKVGGVEQAVTLLQTLAKVSG